MILPFGEVTIFNEDINRPLKEEFVILILGPLFQVVFVFLFLKINYIEDVAKINNFLLIFNLLPIIPLDGSKLLNIIFNKIFSFRTSYLLTVFVSFFFIIFICFWKFNFFVTLVLFFTICKTVKDYLNRKNIFNLFLLERYLNKYSFSKEKIIKNISSMKKDFRHIFKTRNGFITEKRKLSLLFDFDKKVC